MLTQWRKKNSQGELLSVRILDRCESLQAKLTADFDKIIVKIFNFNLNIDSSLFSIFKSSRRHDFQYFLVSQ